MIYFPRLLSLLLLIALLSNVDSWSTLTSRRSILNVHMSSEEAKEWVGAKKFSMKDRYTNTVLSSDQISKILPHRYPFLLVII